MCHLTDRVDAAVLDAGKAGRLRVVANAAVGYDNIDVGRAHAMGITVCNTPGVLDDTTADLAFLLILTATRLSSEAERDLREGRWKGWGFGDHLARDVHGMTLGLVGFGRIGRAVAQRAVGFDMEVIHTARHDTGLHGYVPTLDELLERSDIVSLHVPLTESTRHLIGAAELAVMKPTAVLVNTARGPVVDEDALADALETGVSTPLASTSIDGEPAVNPRLLTAPRATLLPHIGSATIGTRTRMAPLGVPGRRRRPGRAQPAKCNHAAIITGAEVTPNTDRSLLGPLARGSNREVEGYDRRVVRSGLRVEVVAVPTVKGIVVAALSTVATLGSVRASAPWAMPAASATTPSWKTTASYSPLPNVRAVSCARQERRLVSPSVTTAATTPRSSFQTTEGRRGRWELSPAGSPPLRRSPVLRRRSVMPAEERGY